MADSSMTSRANRSMSRTYASSRDIERPLVFEYVAFPDVVRTALDRDFLDEVDVSPNDRLQLVLHLDQVEQSPGRLFVECREEIDIAVIAELAGPQHRPEETELGNPPFAAECFDGVAVEVESDLSVGTHGSFFESMKARLSNLTVAAPMADGQTTNTFDPLRRLTTRDPSWRK